MRWSPARASAGHGAPWFVGTRTEGGEEREVGGQLGFDASGMGDVDGDGAVDYLVTAANDSGGTGKAY